MITKFKLFERLDSKKTISDFVESYNNGDVSEIKEYIEINKDDENNLGIGLIRSYQNIELMQLFLDSGADVNFYKKRFSNVLMWTVHNNEYKSVKFLLENGADPNQNNPITKGNMFGRINYGYGESEAELKMFRLLLDYDAEHFFDEYIGGEYVDIIKEEYPEKYEEYIRNQNLQKYKI